jgi:outer membrane protein assembly factor BamB
MSDSPAHYVTHPQSLRRLVLSAALSVPFLISAARAADWPLWRCDPAATAVTSQRLADELHLEWVLRLPPQQTAWKDEDVMKFDASYLPVVLGRRMFVSSTVNDAVCAYDTRTGKELWRFFAEGPIRTAPACGDGRVVVASDDGHLYCLSADSGRQIWRFRGGPRDRRIVGNQRLISTWPARGGPVIVDGRVYFAVGVWPFMGTFIYAADLSTGRILWHNDATSFTFRRLPHYQSVAFSGLSAQGQLLAAGHRLIVPGSKLEPTVFDRQSGRFLGYAAATGPRIIGSGKYAFAGGSAFDTETGVSVRLPKRACRSGSTVWAASVTVSSPATAGTRPPGSTIRRASRPGR